MYLIYNVTLLVLLIVILVKQNRLSQALLHQEMLIRDQSSWITHCRKDICDKIELSSHEAIRSISRLEDKFSSKCASEQQIGAKANNWDSIREAFKFHSKVDMNE